ncbi:MAG: hypothetical protein ACI9A1_000841, partial [Lentimonas sp.]
RNSLNFNALDWLPSRTYYTPLQSATTTHRKLKLESSASADTL